MRRRRCNVRPGGAALEPRLLLTVQATSPSVTLAFTERFSNSPSLGTFQSPDVLSPNVINAQIDWGDGTVVTQGTINVIPTGMDTFSVTGTHSYTDETAAGAPLPITVVVTDARDNTSATLVDSANVAELDRLAAKPQDVTATENVGFSNAPLAQIVNTNELNPTSDFVATIDWGDGSQSAGQLVGTSGVYTLSGSHTYAEDGAFPVQSVVTDVGGASVTATSTAVVAEAALSATGVAVSAQELTNINAAVATFSHGDGSEPTTDFSATIAWGDGTNGTGTVSETNGIYTVSGSHAYSEDGSYPVSAAITDTSSGSATTTSTASVSELPLSASGVAAAGTELTLLTGTVATFTHGGGSEPTTDFSATIAWGDGTSSTGTVTVANGIYTVSGSHAYSEDGSYPVSAAITDTSSGSATTTSTASVSELPLSATGVAAAGTELTLLTGTVATFTHGGGSEPTTDFSAEIAWGDGTSSTGTVTVTNGIYTVSGSHTYSEDGSYPVSTVITDTSSGSATATSTASVAELPLSATGVAAAGTELTLLTGTVATFTHGGSSEPTSDFTAEIAWGDSISSTGSVTVTNGIYTVSGSHTYAEDGNYQVSVVIDDTSSLANALPTSHISATVTATAHISEAPLSGTGATITGPAFSPLTATVATFSHGSDAEPAPDFSATINWGDGSSSPGEVSLFGGAYSVRGSHTYTAVGTFGVSVQINDLSSGATTVDSTASITAAPVASTAVAVVAEETTTFTGPVVAFTQDGGLAPPSNFSASIDWGDGGRSTGTVSESGGMYTVTGSHTYAEDGSFPITVIVTNIDSGTTTVNNTATVLEAPILGDGLPVTGVETTNATMPVVSFSAGQEPASAFTAVIDWGEGVATPGSVTLLPSGLFQVIGTYAYLDEGTYPIAVTVSESGEPSTSTVLRATATISEGPPGVDKPGIAGTPAQDYISQIYRDVLDRPVDRPSSAVLVNLLLAGQPRLALTELLAHSPEYLRLVVTHAYQTYLGRAPDADGLAYWTAALGRGVSDEQLAASMIASDEFFHAAGGDNRDWVDAMYPKLLSRTADSGGEAFWLGALTQGETRSQVALAIATSPEHEASIVTADYAQFLRRTAGPDEVNSWVLQLNAGMSDEELLARVVASDEYFDRLSEVQ